MADLAARAARREPPPFRPVTVVGTEHRSPHLVRVRLGGEALAGLDPGLPAASVRVLLPRPGADGVELPTWNGNEFLDADGARPLLRTLTPLVLDPAGPTLDVEVVLHGDAPLSTWARDAVLGTPAAVSGTGRGYAVDRGAATYLLAGDESAMPAISTLLPHLPPVPTTVLVEVRDASARVALAPAAAPHVEVAWVTAAPGAPPGDALVAAVTARTASPAPDGLAVWAAGEAAAVQRIRRHLFEVVGLPRAQAVVRGYWKVGRAEA